MDCFKKVLKLADVLMNNQPDPAILKIYIEILNKFLYFLEEEDFTSVI